MDARARARAEADESVTPEAAAVMTGCDRRTERMSTREPVVIALDGSLHDASTLAWGTAEAALRHARVVLVRVVSANGPLVQGEWLPTPYSAPHTDEAMYLEGMMVREGARRPGLVVTRRLVHGPQVEALQELSRTSQLVVVGRQRHVGRYGGRRVGALVAARASCPVAVVRGRAGNHGDGPVVVGVDGSRQSIAAAHLAADEAALRRCRLVVLHSERSSHALFHRAPVGAEHAASQVDAGERIAATIRSEHPEADVIVDVVHAHPADALVDRSAKAALVVVGCRGLGMVRTNLLGSVSSEVVRRAAGTVIVVHEPAPR